MWSLSGSKNMTSLLQTLCVPAEPGASLLVAAIGMKEEELEPILAEVQGERCDLSLLGAGHGEDKALREKLKKLYKIPEEELGLASMEDCVVTRMAAKDH
ncbi:unnamed protein product [Discosporangium mesarthrocarpum]